MEIVSKQIKQLLVILLLALAYSKVAAQVKHKAPKLKHPAVSSQFTDFMHLAADANIVFMVPPGFVEMKAPDNDYFTFDYAMMTPGKDFEIWFQVKSEKENWLSYEKSKSKPNSEMDNPDSTYIALGKAHASEFAGDNKYFVRNIPHDVLARYNADAGKSYLLNLPDLLATKHYKYALLITLQKDHTGIIMAVCFTNDKGPEFFKNMDKASNCIKFKS